jgi:hypothetical protein
VVEYYKGYSQLQVHPNLLTKTISSITNSNPCVVTTEYPHFYVAGMTVSLLIPPQYGMQQLNNRVIQVLAVTTNTLTLNVNSLGYTPFAYPAQQPTAFTNPTVFAVSSGPYLSPPPPLPYGNNDSFEGVVYNNGPFGDSVNGM